MGAVDLPQRSSSRKPSRRRRLGVRVDMTPMVDVAFLLLIFFMVTTIFRTPQALEIALPPKNAERIVAQDHVLDLRVSSTNHMFWNMAGDSAHPVPVTVAQLSPILRAHAAADDRLVVVIKIDKDASFHDMVDVIDELDLARVTRFSMAPLTDEERREIETLQAS